MKEQAIETSTLLASRSLDGEKAARNMLLNFYLMSFLYSINHGSVIACLALATARLGAVGASQSGVLSIAYMASALLGATYVSKRFGAKVAMVIGMAMCMLYVGCFWVATTYPSIQVPSALIGGAIGGIANGIEWTAQGVYFTEASKQYSAETSKHIGDCNSKFAGIFAAIYLTTETVLRSLSTILVKFVSWQIVFATYTAFTAVTSLGMLFVTDYRQNSEEHGDTKSVFHQVTAAARLLRDRKMQWMVFSTATFGFASSFLNSYVNGEVISAALNDADSVFVGALSSFVPFTAAFMSFALSGLPKGRVMVGGFFAFFLVAFPFILRPDPHDWNLIGLLVLFGMGGTGRATFESTLRATFADFFAHEKEGAFANIILHTGLSCGIGYFLSFHLHCSQESTYCLRYSDGSLHHVLSYELLICVTALLAVIGYQRAAAIHRQQQADKAEVVLNA